MRPEVVFVLVGILEDDFELRICCEALDVVDAAAGVGTLSDVATSNF